MKKTKQEQQKYLIKKLRRMRCDLTKLSEFLTEHLDYNPKQHQDSLQSLSRWIADYEEILSMM